MSVNRLIPDQVLLLEQAILQAPLDSLRKVHKQTQKTYEYNLQPSSTFATDLAALLSASALHAGGDAGAGPLPPAQRAELLARVDAMIARMRTLHRKLTDLTGQSERALDVAQARLDHLAALPDSIQSPDYPPWARRRLSHHIVDYLLRANPPMKRTARAFADHEGIQNLVDDELWDDLAQVEHGLDSHSLDQVLAWVGANRTALKKLKSPLEFRIHLQAYIELCRQRDLPKAIHYARKHLSHVAAAELDPPSGDPMVMEAGSGEASSAPTYMDELEQVLALLAYGPDTLCRPYRELYSPARWSSLRALFRSTFLSLHSLPSIPLLHMSLQAGIAALKTPICVPLPADAPTAPPSAYPIGARPLRTMITPEGDIILEAPTPAPVPVAASLYPVPPPPGAVPARSDPAESSSSSASTSSSAVAPASSTVPVHTLEGNPSPQCPLCSSPLRLLGPEVPYSHHVNSTIVCPLTGRVVEGDGGEGGQLVALVSRVTGEGRVYSREGLVLRASQHPEGKIVDPVTGETFEWEDLKKVFIS